MRHKTAARRGENGGWHYVNLGREGGYPIGYCSDHEPHETEAEARECYGQYVREETIRLNVSGCSWTSCDGFTDLDPGKPIVALPRCRQPANRTAYYGDDGYGILAFCAEHMTAEQVIRRAQLEGPAGDAWVS